MAEKIPLERKITDRILCNLRSKGGWWFKTHGGAMQVAGIPDIIGVFHGRFVGLEVKRPTVGRATALQISMLRQLFHNGGVAAIVTSWEDAEAVLRNYVFLDKWLLENTTDIGNFEVFLRTWYNNV